MKHRSLPGTLTALCIMFALIWISSSSAVAQTFVQGVVTDSIFNPVEGAIVKIGSTYIGADTTDAAGYFSFSGYPPGVYRLSFSHSDYFDTLLNQVELPQDESISVNVSMRHRPANDVGAIRFLIPDSRSENPVIELTEYRPQVQIQNVGYQPKSFNVYYEVRSPDSVNVMVADTLNIFDMPANSLDTVQFLRSFILPTDYAYSLIAYASLPDDVNPSNDTCQIAGITARGFFIIFGNKDGSVQRVHTNDYLLIDIWGGTPLDDYADSIGYMNIPLASDDNVIAQRFGGFFNNNYLAFWDSLKIFAPENHDSTPEILDGYTSQSLVAISHVDEPPDPEHYFWTNGDTVRIGTFGMQITGDTAVTSDTARPFMIGYSRFAGGLWWQNVNGGAGRVPRVSFPTLYVQRQYEFGCEYLPGDINGNGSANGIDVSYAVGFLKGAALPVIDCNPPCTELSNPFYAAMDVNGTCSVNGIDITYFVVYLKGGPALSYCPSCPPAPER